MPTANNADPDDEGQELFELSLPGFFPEISDRHVWSAVRATMLAPRPKQDHDERHRLFDAFLRQHTRIESRLLEDEGHPSAALLAQVGQERNLENPIDDSEITRRFTEATRALHYVAHASAYLLIAAILAPDPDLDLDPGRANHARALESWNRLHGSQQFRERWARRLRETYGSVGPLALADAWAFMARNQLNTEDHEARWQFHLKLLATSNNIACRLETIRLRNQAKLFQNKYFWKPRRDWFIGVPVARMSRLSPDLYYAVIDGSLDPIPLLGSMGRVIS